MANGFGPMDLDAARMNGHLVRPTPLSIRAGPLDQNDWWLQMAVLGRGMEVRVGAGVGWMQFRVVTTPDPSFVTIGLVPAGASVDIGAAPECEGAGWDGDGDSTWSLPGPEPDSGVVMFDQGDRVPGGAGLPRRAARAAAGEQPAVPGPPPYRPPARSALPRHCSIWR